MSIVGYLGMIPTRGRKIFRDLRACMVIHESIIHFICFFFLFQFAVL